MAKSIEVINKSRSVGKWLGRIAVAKKLHDDNFVQNAKLWRDFYEGNHFPGIGNRSDLVVINYTYSILKAILPQIYFQDPYIYLSAKRQQFTENRQLTEDSLNDTWREIKVKRQIKRIVLDHLVMGFGIGKLGYWFDTEKPESLETQAEFTEFVKEEYPYFLRQSPFDVVFDFEAKSFDEIRWLAARYYIPLEDLKKKYSGKTKDIKGNYTAGDELATKVLNNNAIDKDYIDTDLKRVEVWEISDLVDRKIHVVTEENKDDFLDSFNNPYKDIQSNYKILFVNEIPDKLYPISDVTNLKDINLWMDRVNSMLMQDIMKSQRKILYEEDAFASEEEYQKFLSGEDLQTVKLAPGAIKEGKILVVAASIIPQDFYNNNELCKDHLNQVSGVGSDQRGVADNVERRTAKEAVLIDQKAQLRNSERLDAVTDYCIGLAGDLLKIMQQFGSKETEFYNPQRGYQSWTKDSISGEYNVKIEIGSTVRRDVESERQFIMQFGSQLLGVVDDNGVPVVDKRKFSKLVLEKFGISIEDIDEVMLSPDEYLEKIGEAIAIQQQVNVMQQPQETQSMAQSAETIPPEMAMQQEAMPQGQPIELTPEEQALLQGV